MLDTAPITEFTGDYRFLSNFHDCEVIYNGDKYPSVEHAYQAAKCEDINDCKLFQVGSAGHAKQLGRTVNVVPCWNKVKLDVMRGLLEQKFRQARFGQQLLNTNDRHLSEGNRWGDRYWGIDLHTGQGLNHLGVMLMDIRSELETDYGAMSDEHSLMEMEPITQDTPISGLLHANIDIAASYPNKHDLNDASTEKLLRHHFE